MNHSMDDYLCSGITTPHPHDVCCGRGAGITKHAGNKRWRQLIHDNRERYMALPRNQRPIIFEAIVKAVRSLSPPGHFLAQDPLTKLWHEIGEEKAVEKTAQAMRDSKKTSRNSSPVHSPQWSTAPVLQAAAAALRTAAPFVDSDIHCSPQMTKPSLRRISTEDSFSQRMEGFTFTAPTLKQEPSNVFQMMAFDSGNDVSAKAASSSGWSNTNVECSPSIVKPSMERESTFDKKLEGFSFSVPQPPSYKREESACSMTSFDMLPAEEFEILQASCGVPAKSNYDLFGGNHNHNNQGENQWDEGSC